MWRLDYQVVHRHCPIPHAFGVALRISCGQRTCKLPSAAPAVPLKCKTAASFRQHSAYWSLTKHQQFHRLGLLRATAGTPQDDSVSQHSGSFKNADFGANMHKAAKRQLRKLDGLWGRFIPMVSLCVLHRSASSCMRLVMMH